jgi:selenide,water dikinase
VTGFGLVGHGWEMAERSGAVLVFDTSALPLYDGALETAEAGVRTGGDARNRTYLEGRVTSSAPSALDALAFDPQTSGGLLAAVDPAVIGQLDGFTMVGTVEVGGPGVRVT